MTFVNVCLHEEKLHIFSVICNYMKSIGMKVELSGETQYI